MPPAHSTDGPFRPAYYRKIPTAFRQRRRPARRLTAICNSSPIKPFRTIHKMPPIRAAACNHLQFLSHQAFRRYPQNFASLRIDSRSFAILLLSSLPASSSKCRYSARQLAAIRNSSPVGFFPRQKIRRAPRGARRMRGCARRRNFTFACRQTSMRASR